LLDVPHKGEQIMERRVPPSTTMKWAEAITARVEAVADQLRVKGHNLTDINSATADRLQSLSGIGAVIARKIVEGRPYRNTDELVTKNILLQSTYDRVKDQIVASQP
jgi:DNA uptake protein ComE-like DNA-binding protein